MLSHTPGWRKRKRRIQESEVSMASKQCPHEQRGVGQRCRLFAQEQSLRPIVLQQLQRLEAEAEASGRTAPLPTLNELMDERMKKRCRYHHNLSSSSIQVISAHPPSSSAPPLSASSMADLLVSYFLAKTQHLPLAIRRKYIAEEEDITSDDQSGSSSRSESDDEPSTTNKEEEEGDDSTGNDHREIESDFELVVHSPGRFDCSFLREALPAFCASSACGGDSAAPSPPPLDPHDIDLGNANFCRVVVCAMTRVADQEKEPVRTVALRGVHLKSADELISAMKKYGVSETIREIDVSHNKLQSLQFLFSLRASFPRLVSLAVKKNPVFQKPDIVEMVRRTLPQLARMDGEMLRRPPLALPFPVQSTNESVHESAMKFIQKFFEKVECHEFDEDSVSDFLDPNVTASVSVLPGCILYDPLRHVYQEDAAAAANVQPLSPSDVKHLHVLQVSITNASRNLKLGMASMHRCFRGILPALNFYTSTLYPPALQVDHHFGFLHASVDEIKNSATTEPTTASTRQMRDRKRKKGGSGQQQPQQQLFGLKCTRDFVIVTLHGTMSWRAVSMKNFDAVRLHFDRVLTLTKIPPPIIRRSKSKKTSWGNSNGDDDNVDSSTHRVYNDSITLRPIQADGVLFSQLTKDRQQRWCSLFAVDDQSVVASRVVHPSMERCTSDKSTWKTLEQMTMMDLPSTRLDDASLSPSLNNTIRANNAAHTQQIGHR